MNADSCLFFSLLSLSIFYFYSFQISLLLVVFALPPSNIGHEQSNYTSSTFSIVCDFSETQSTQKNKAHTITLQK